MEQQQKKKQESSAMEQGSSNAAAATSSSMPVSSADEAAPNQVETQGEAAKTFEDMSVDELNTLSPEQRRDQMLQALDRRTSGSS